MTMMQNVGILLSGLLFELIMYMFIIFYDKNDRLVIGLMAMNIFVFLAILLAWANGLKFPLK